VPISFILSSGLLTNKTLSVGRGFIIKYLSLVWFYRAGFAAMSDWEVSLISGAARTGAGGATATRIQIETGSASR
jgi:hypothetical protein